MFVLLIVRVLLTGVAAERLAEDGILQVTGFVALVGLVVTAH